ncbi:HNH endonuclease [Methylobacterium organophilum]|uniref:HNH endonuclease n=1 Tax=Methylobacterium organophilum TaxID=410 RepID=UPI003570BB41
MRTDCLPEARSGLTIERLRALLHYDPETGLWTWLKSYSRVKAGQKAGSLKKSGYVFIVIKGTSYRSHRLAWFYMTGKWPPEQLDHRDGCRSNNRWNNLRLATDSLNQANSKKPANNTSGYKGVYWNRQHRKWSAKINVQRRQVHLGSYSNIENAAEAYRLGALKYFGRFSRTT